MREVATYELRPGGRLALPIVAPNGQVLVEGQTTITPPLIAALIRGAVRSVWLEDGEPGGPVTAAPAGDEPVPAATAADGEAEFDRYHHWRFAGAIEEPLMATMAEVSAGLLRHRGGVPGAHHPVSPRDGRQSAPAAAPTVFGGGKKVLSLRSNLATVLSDPDQLPTVPAIYHRLAQIIDDPKTTVNEVSDVVGSDPVCASRVLRLVNSPFYGMRGQVTTVSQGVKLLGFETVRSLVLAITSEGVFGGQKGANARTAEQLWYHSIGVGVAARVIAKQRKVVDPELAFIAGLLHDIGKIVLLRCAPEALSETMEAAAVEQIAFIEAENKVCGINHTRVGGMLGERWGFPPNLVEATTLHHRPDQAKVHPELAAVVHVADSIGRALDIGSGGDALAPPLHRSARALLKLDSARLTDIMLNVDEDYPNVKALLTAA